MSISGRKQGIEFILHHVQVPQTMFKTTVFFCLDMLGKGTSLLKTILIVIRLCKKFDNN